MIILYKRNKILTNCCCCCIYLSVALSSLWFWQLIFILVVLYLFVCTLFIFTNLDRVVKTRTRSIFTTKKKLHVIVNDQINGPLAWYDHHFILCVYVCLHDRFLTINWAINLVKKQIGLCQLYIWELFSLIRWPANTLPHHMYTQKKCEQFFK